MATRNYGGIRSLQADDPVYARRDMGLAAQKTTAHTVALQPMYVRLGGHSRYGVSAGGPLLELAARGLMALSSIRKDKETRGQ